MPEAFEHRALGLTNYKPLIYTAMSKHLFYFRMQISTFVFKNGGVPLNPFMISEYFMNDAVERDIIREANNSIVAAAKEIWVFGAVSNGVLAEIKLAKAQNKPIRYFEIIKSLDIKEITRETVVMEDEVAQFRNDL